MPYPDSQITNYRPDLAAGFEQIDLAMERKGFIGLQVCPAMDVELVANDFSKVPLEELLETHDTSRAPGGGYGRGRFTFQKDAYQCEENGWEEPVDAREDRMYGNYLKSDQLAASRAFDIVLRNQEIRIADLFFSTTTFAGDLTHESDLGWIDADCDIAAEVEIAVQAAVDACGIWPNAIALDKRAFRLARNSPGIIERIKYSGRHDPTAKKVTASVLADVFDLDFVYVAGSIKNNAGKNLPRDLAGIWSPDRALVFHVDTTPDTKVPSTGRTFHWTGDGSEIGGAFDEYFEPQIRSRVIRVRHDTHEKLFYPELGHLITGIAAAAE